VLIRDVMSLYTKARGLPVRARFLEPWTCIKLSKPGRPVRDNCCVEEWASRRSWRSYRRQVS
jgi:hypothetical protein